MLYGEYAADCGKGDVEAAATGGDGLATGGGGIRGGAIGTGGDALCTGRGGSRGLMMDCCGVYWIGGGGPGGTQCCVACVFDTGCAFIGGGE
jgi:hypothetical protein